MNYSFSISTRQGDEYRIMFIDADISVLADSVQQTIIEQGNDISEIMIDRVKGARVLRKRCCMP